MPFYIWILIAIISLLIFFVISGLIVTAGIITPKRRSLLETRILEEEKYPGIMEFYSKNLNNTYKIKSRFGYDLALYFIKSNDENKKYLVMSHGHTYTHHGCLKYARMMMKHGYNIILYDQRFHGDSGGRFTTLGYYEKYDLYDIVSDTFSRYGDDIELGTFGESMGAATVILEAEIDDRIRYLFADCSFSDFQLLMKEVLGRKIRFLKRLFLFSGEVIFRLITKFPMNRISPKRALASIHIPIYFAHGREDNFIRVNHTTEMYDSYTGSKSLFIGENNSRHAEAYLKNQKEYEQSISEHIIKYIAKAGIKAI